MHEEKLWLTSFSTRNNIQVKVRFLQTDDAPLLLDIFERMGEESRYQRFNQSVENLSEKRIRDEADLIVETTTANGSGLIAFADLPEQGEVPVAAARYVHLSPEKAEVAMSVRDDFQGQGIGTTLLNLLLEEAKKRGLRSLVGMLQNSNTGMWIVFDRIPYKVTRVLDGFVSDVEVHLNELKPEE
jgi:acetyltransferase